MSDHFGEDVTSTEWVRRVEALQLPKLVRHLGGPPGESTLETLARCGDGALEDALLVRGVVPYEDDTGKADRRQSSLSPTGPVSCSLNATANAGTKVTPSGCVPTTRILSPRRS